MPSRSPGGTARKRRAEATQRCGSPLYLVPLGLVAVSVAALISACTSARTHVPSGSPCSRRIAYTQGAGGYNGSAIMVRSECGNLVRKFIPPNGLAYTEPAVAPNGQAVTFLATSYKSPSNATSLDAGDLASGSISRLRAFNGEVSNPSYSPDGQYIALFWTGPYRRPPEPVCIYMLNSADGSVASRYCYHTSPTSPYMLSWSPNGRVILESRPDSSDILESSTLFEVRVDHLASAHLELTPRGDLIGAFFSPDGKSLLLDYAPQNGLAQLWSYDIATGQLTQLTDVSDGIVAAAIANNWSVYYRSGSGTRLYELNMQSGESRLIAVTPATTNPELSVQQAGALHVSPSIAQPIAIHHSALDAFLGSWYVHDGGLCIGGTLSIPVPKIGSPPCSGTSHSGWLDWYEGFGAFTKSHIPIDFGWAKLIFRHGPDNTMIVTVQRVLYTTTGGTIVPGFHQQGTLQRGDTFELRVEATGLLRSIYLHTHLSRLDLKYGNPYWCDLDVSPANQSHCGA